jgi:hypothetical protein
MGQESPAGKDLSREEMLVLYQAVAARRQNFDSMVWQVPALSLDPPADSGRPFRLRFLNEEFSGVNPGAGFPPLACPAACPGSWLGGGFGRPSGP